MSETMNALPMDIVLEAVVCVLLMASIFYCGMLARRLKAMRSGQDGLRKLIADLTSATGQAADAIVNLKAANDAAGLALNEQIKRARGLTEELNALIDGGSDTAQRLRNLEERRQSVHAQAPRPLPQRAPLPQHAPVQQRPISFPPQQAAAPRVMPSAPAQPQFQPQSYPQARPEFGDAATSNSELNTLINLLKRAQGQG